MIKAKYIIKDDVHTCHIERDRHRNVLRRIEKYYLTQPYMIHCGAIKVNCNSRCDSYTQVKYVC